MSSDEYILHESSGTAARSSDEIMAGFHEIMARLERLSPEQARYLDELAEAALRDISLDREGD